MLANLSPKQVECLTSAVRCRELAERAQTSLERNEYVEMAERWERLARSYGYSARLDDFIASIENKTR
jgi:hypothetical protein